MGGWTDVTVWACLIKAIKTKVIKVNKYNLSALRYIILGNQPIPSILLEDTKKIFPELQVVGNEYLRDH